MTFWIIALGLTLCVAWVLAKALRHARDDGPRPAHDVNVYRAQLRDTERDIARKLISPAEAERLRLEISRRLLAADAASPRPQVALSPQRAGLIGAAVAAILLVLAVGLYQQMGAPGYADQPLAARKAQAQERRASRPSQSALEAALPAAAPATPSPEYQALVDQLRQAVQSRPDDLQGHELLARNEANLGNYAAAARALAQITRIKGDAATPADLVNQADMMVIAAGGLVSPQAEDILTRALALDQNNGTARYYMGLMMAQTGRPDMAFRIWNTLLRSSAETDVWVAPIRAQIEQIAALAGAEYTPPTKGPDASDIAAAQDLSASDRSAMINAMVRGLSDELSDRGGPVQKWAQLITALAVLNRLPEAQAVLTDAQQAFKDDAQAQAILSQAAQQAGLGE